MTKKRLSHDAEKMRLQKFLSLAGVASRRHAEEMIRAGRVKISGRVVTEMGVLVHPTKSKVEVDNKAVIFQEERNYILFHKPAGCITSLDDPEGRTTVIDLLPKSLPRVYPVGRLDYDSEGLLLLTNDGELAYKLSHPGSNVPRVYHVKVRGELKDGSAVLERLKTGLELEDGFVKADRVAVLSFTGNNTWLEIELHIGRNRIVRRMMEEVNFPVMKLRRVSFGNLSLDGLPLGGFRDLSETELRETYKQLGETGPLPERRGKDGIRFARGFSPKDREHPRQSAHNMRHDEERPKRTFERGENSEFSSREERPRRRFTEDERPKRRFERGENSEFSSREERPRRRFTEDERPKRRFERKERSEFSTQEEAPRRINDGDERSRRTNERGDRRTSEFSSRDERPRRQNDGDERPRRTFERSDRRTSEFSSRDERPQRRNDGDERSRRTNERGDRRTSEFSSRDERPQRRNDGDERSRRTNEHSDRRTSEFSSREERPRRQNDGDERSRRTNERSDRRTSEFSSRDERPRRRNDGDERPRRTNERGDKSRSNKSTERKRPFASGIKRSAGRFPKKS